MAFEGIFKAQFDSSVNKALTTGIKGAFSEGCTYGVASGLIYLAEVLLFLVVAVIISRWWCFQLLLDRSLWLSVSFFSNDLSFIHRPNINL